MAISKPTNRSRLLERAERWLPEHCEDAALLLTCAQLATRAELYGKARSFLETSIAIRPRLEAYQLLASLMEQLGERERAIEGAERCAGVRGRSQGESAEDPHSRWLDRRQNDRRRP